MPDEPDEQPFHFAISPVVTERHARTLIDVLAGFAGGTTSEELRRRFEQVTGLRRQMFYDSLKFAKHRHWVIGGSGHSKLYQLNPDQSWKPIQTSAGEKMERDRLEHLVESQTQQLEGLQDEVEHLRNWSSGIDANGNTNGGNIALSSLIKIVGDGAASTRQRIKAAGAVLGYRVQDDSAVEFTKRFLQSVCTSADIATDYRIEAGELLRKHEAPRIASETVKPSYSNDATGATRTEAWRVYERWQLKKQIVLETRGPPKPGWDNHLQADTYAAPEGNSMPPVRVVTDPASGFRLLDNLLPKTAYRIGNGIDDDK